MKNSYFEMFQNSCFYVKKSIRKTLSDIAGVANNSKKLDI